MPTGQSLQTAADNNSHFISFCLEVDVISSKIVSHSMLAFCLVSLRVL